jgi:hypothetical protein
MGEQFIAEFRPGGGGSRTSGNNEQISSDRPEPGKRSNRCSCPPLHFIPHNGVTDLLTDHNTCSCLFAGVALHEQDKAFPRIAIMARVNSFKVVASFENSRHLYGEALSAFLTTTFENVTAAFGRHAGAKTVNPFPSQVMRLEGAFHRASPWLQSTSIYRLTADYSYRFIKTGAGSVSSNSSNAGRLRPGSFPHFQSLG